MSGICAVGGSAPLEVVATVFDACEAADAPARGTWIAEGAALCVARAPWECAPSIAGAARVQERAGVALVSDAAIYYREDLFGVAGVPAGRRSEDPGEALLETYLHGGLDALRHIEGDYAFVLWDSRTRLLVAARDSAGSRTLFYAQTATGVIVASTHAAVLAHPDCNGALNHAVLAETAAGAWGSAEETAYAAVRSVTPGSMLLWRPGTRPVLRAFREPLRVLGDSRLRMDDAAAELRYRIQRAAVERAPAGEPAAVWMSGGLDSTAVFGLGRAAGLTALTPVSVSYPEGDPGREDEAIEQVAGMWGAPVQWLSIDNLPMLTDLPARMRARATPFAHPFANWNAGLAARSHQAGARVAFSGYGGDQVFHVSDVFLADLLVRGRWLELARQLHSGGNARQRLFRWTLHPALPQRARSLMHRMAGWPETHYLERPLPFWIRRDFAERHDLAARAAGTVPLSRWNHASSETEFYLRCPYFPRVLAEVTAIARTRGVEVRSPLFDDRVLELALSRPRTDRNDGRSTKRLLRRAVRDVLPRSVTEPKPFKTGLTSGYFERSLRAEGEPLARTLMKDSMLADLGIVEPKDLESAWNRYMRAGGENTGTALLFTLQTELWLRGRTESGRVQRISAAAEARAAR